MAGTFWNRDELTATKADSATQTISSLLDDFRTRWEPKEPEPVAQQPIRSAANPSLGSFSFDLKALTPWASHDEEPTQQNPAKPSKTQANSSTSLFDLDALTPWARPKMSEQSERASGLQSTIDVTPADDRASTTPPAAGVAASRPAASGDRLLPMSQATSGPKGTIDNSSRQAFVRTAWPYMLEAAGGNTDAAEMMLAAAISENGDVGKGGDFIGNNFFGIKGKGDAGSFNAATWEDYGGGPVNIRDDFAAYSSPVAGFRAFFDFLQNNSRYAPALARYRETGDAAQLFRDVNAAGYATDKQWASKVENIRANQVAPVVRTQDVGAVTPPASAALNPPAGSGSSPAPVGRGLSDSASLASPSSEDAYRVPLGGDPMQQTGYGDPLPAPMPGTRGGEAERNPPPLPGARLLPGEGRDDPASQGQGWLDRAAENSMYRAPLLPTDPEASTGAEWVDPDQGPRESGYAMPPATYGEGGDDPGTAPYQPAELAPRDPEPPLYGPTPVAPPSAIQAVENARAGMADQEELAPRSGGGIIDTLGAAAGAARQAVVDEVYPTDPVVQATNAGKLPMQRGLELIQAAVDAGNTEIGRRIGRAAGLTDDELFTIWGIPVSAEDIAGFAGSVVLDPTNLISAGPARRAVVEAAEQARPIVQRGARALAEEGARQLIDLTPTPRIVQPGEGGTIPRDAWQRNVADELGVRPRQEQIETPYTDSAGRQVTNYPTAEWRTVQGEAGPEMVQVRRNFFGNAEEVPGSRQPLDSVYRVVSREDYEQSLRRGYLQSDGRLNLDADEGTVASAFEPSPFYNPKNTDAVAVRIRVDPQDGWRLDTDGYVKTTRPIPVDRIESTLAYTTDEMGNAVRYQPRQQPGLIGRARQALQANNERVAAADARMAAEGSTAAPGTLGVAMGTDLQGAVRPRVVPPEVADTLDFPIRIPEDPAVIRAIEAAGGTVDPERGVTLGVTRAQSPSGAGATATRGGVFYEAIPEGGRSTYADYPDDPKGVGGSQIIPRTQTRFRSPLVLMDAPGASGFDEAMERFGATFDFGGGPTPITSRDVDLAINIARSHPVGSPERAATLKDFVRAFGGDPNLIDDLLAVRGADASESGWAIKENILAHQARAKGYDGVITVQQQPMKQGDQMALIEAVDAHPDVKAAAAEVRAASDAYYASPTPEAAQRVREATRNVADVRVRVTEELRPYHITELMDPREARNPVPTTQSPDWQAAHQKVERLGGRLDELSEEMDRMERYLTDDELRNMQREWNRLRKEFDAAVSEREALRGAHPGYTLRSDIPRRGGETTATATAGTLPDARTSDPLAAVNRVLGQGVASAVSGGVGAQVNQAMNPDDPDAAIKGFAVGALGPVAAARGMRAIAGRAGATAGADGGAMAALGNLPPGQQNQVAQIAQQILQQKPVAAGAPQQNVVRNIARGVQRAAKQQQAPVPPSPIPGLPTPPPNAPVTWWDIAQSWRYGVGLFGNVSTALMQTMGGLGEVGLGAPTEIIRQAIIRGHPEHVPLIAAEAIKSIPAGFRSAGQTIKGNVPQTIMAGTDYRPPTSDRMAPGAGRNLVFAAETPGRIATQAPDALWYEIFYRTGLAQAAAEEAQKTVSRWNPLASVQAQRQLIANPTPEVMARAHQFAQDSTYKGDLGAMLGTLETAVRGGPQSSETRKAIGSILMPVYHTIARIHEGALEFTPGIGALPLEKAGLAAKGRPLDQKVAQQVMAVGLFGTMMGYAASGGIRGPGPDDPEKRRMMMDDGYVPNTTNVGGYWVPNQYFGRAGPILNAIGSLNDAVLYHDQKKGKFSEQALQKQTETMLKNLGRSFRDYPFVEAVATLTEIAEDPVGALGRFAGETASTYSPALIRTAATMTEDKVHRPERDPDKPILQTITDTFQQRSGIGRESLPVAQDVLGREVENQRQGAAALFPRMGADKRDPIINAFLDPAVGVDIGRPPTSFTEDGVKIDLTPAQQRAYQRYMGDEIIRGFSRADGASDRRRAAAFRDLYEAARAKAQQKIKADMGRSEIRERVKAGAGR